MVEDDGVAQMQGVREEVRDREDVPDLSFREAVNIFTKEDRGLVEVGSLARGIT